MKQILLESYASEQVRDEMQMEDDYIKDLLDKDKLLAEQKKELGLKKSLRCYEK